MIVPKQGIIQIFELRWLILWIHDHLLTAISAKEMDNNKNNDSPKARIGGGGGININLSKSPPPNTPAQTPTSSPVSSPAGAAGDSPATPPQGGVKTPFSSPTANSTEESNGAAAKKVIIYIRLHHSPYLCWIHCIYICI